VATKLTVLHPPGNYLPSSMILKRKNAAARRLQLRKKKWKPGLVLGHKKLISLVARQGKREYWKVECLICGSVSVLNKLYFKPNRHCKLCRRVKNGNKS
jgi:hypothetical protein